MRILSYSTSEQQSDQIKTFIKTFDEGAFHLSFQETNGKDGFHMFLDTMKDGDTVLFYSIQEIFDTVSAFLMFLRLCLSKQIRIISILDEIDSSDDIFPLSASTQWMKILCSLKSDKSEQFDDAQSELIGNSPHDNMLKRHKMVINLYTAGYSINEILRLCGYKARPQVYRILRKYGIELQFPNMQRKKKGNE